MFVLPFYIRLLDRIHALINFEILWVYICLIIGLVLFDLYKFLFKKNRRNKAMFIRVVVYSILLIVIRSFYYIQFEKTFSLEVSNIDQIMIDVKDNNNVVIQEDLQHDSEFIELIKNLEFTLEKVETNGYTTSDVLTEIRIASRQMYTSNLYIVINEEKVLNVYVVGGPSLTLHSDHKSLLDYILRLKNE